MITSTNSTSRKGSDITAKSWVIASGTSGYVLHGKKERVRRECASLTKIMTLYVVVHYCRKTKLDPKKYTLRVSKESSSLEGTSAYLREGDQLTVWDLLHAMMLPSGNDAAWALAEGIGKLISQGIKKSSEFLAGMDGEENTEEDPVTVFIREMNRRASDVRMFETCFANPTGLAHSYNKTTASDLARLCSKVMGDEWIARIARTRQYRCRVPNDLYGARDAYWENTNKLLINENYNGIKTGITPAAGPCLATSFHNDKTHLIIILLNSRSMEDRWQETTALVNYALNNLVSKAERAK